MKKEPVVWDGLAVSVAFPNKGLVVPVCTESSKEPLPTGFSSAEPDIVFSKITYYMKRSFAVSVGVRRMPFPGVRDDILYSVLPAPSEHGLGFFA